MGGDQASPSKRSVPASPVETERPTGAISAPPGCTSAVSTFTQSTPVAIPTGPAVVTSTLVVSGANPFLFDVNATTFITHTFAADLDITITSPAGTVVTLTTDNGAGNDNVFNGPLWDDDANPGGQVPYTTNSGLVTAHPYVDLITATPLVPEEAMGAFIDEDPNGTWIITISDDLAGDGGSLDSWALEITTATCVQPCILTCPANVTVANDPNQCDAVVNYPAPTTSGTCGTVTCAPPYWQFLPGRHNNPNLFGTGFRKWGNGRRRQLFIHRHGQ
jgi:subtilisin-like proprotein convertase family protein